MGYTVEDLYYLRNGPDAPPCPQPRRLKWFAYAMGLIAGEVEARKHGLSADPGRTQRAPRVGVDIRMPGGSTGFKQTAPSEG